MCQYGQQLQGGAQAQSQGLATPSVQVQIPSAASADSSTPTMSTMQFNDGASMAASPNYQPMVQGAQSIGNGLQALAAGIGDASQQPDAQDLNGGTVLMNPNNPQYTGMFDLRGLQY